MTVHGPTVLVLPCFNEAKRLDPDRMASFLEQSPGVEFLFVDDGSTDSTVEVLQELCAGVSRCSYIALPRNVGKAEAVRQGMLAALARRPVMAGYWDADLAIPLETIHTFVSVLRQRPEIQLVIGSRVQLMGRIIARNPRRHYLGRVFATVASVVTGMPVYDTQCGAKLFRVSDLVHSIFDKPFVSRWIFDVEVLARLARLTRTAGIAVPVYEHPLEHWVDVPGSKVRAAAYLQAGFEMLEIWQEYSRGQPRALPDTPAGPGR